MPVRGESETAIALAVPGNWGMPPSGPLARISGLAGSVATVSGVMDR